MTKVAPFWIYPKSKCQQCNTKYIQKSKIVECEMMVSNVEKHKSGGDRHQGFTIIYAMIFIKMFMNQKATEYRGRRKTKKTFSEDEIFLARGKKIY